MKEEVSQHLFNQGLLLAARAAGAPDEFVSEGPDWNSAFAVVVHHVKDDPKLKSWASLHLRMDPIFRNWPAASELLLQGEHDLLLGHLSPDFRRAAFLVKPEEAKRELLREFPHTDWFEEVGSVFANVLRQCSSGGLERSPHKG